MKNDAVTMVDVNAGGRKCSTFHVIAIACHFDRREKSHVQEHRYYVYLLRTLAMDGLRSLPSVEMTRAVRRFANRPYKMQLAGPPEADRMVAHSST